MKRSAIVLILWTLILLGLLLAPFSDARIPAVNGFRFDKIAHFGLFFITGVVTVYGAGFSRFRDRLRLGLIFGLLLAMGTEVAQFFIPLRHADFYDLLADIAGLSLGLIFSALFHRRANVQ